MFSLVQIYEKRLKCPHASAANLRLPFETQDSFSAVKGKKVSI